ncbi:MAG: hypothetical protein LBR32_09785, partial [Propionibacteriaceae bacterium]|nr:hypothetical protein [Propionibacteriaceae bacterium]
KASAQDDPAAIGALLLPLEIVAAQPEYFLRNGVTAAQLAALLDEVEDKSADLDCSPEAIAPAVADDCAAIGDKLAQARQVVAQQGEAGR